MDECRGVRAGKGRGPQATTSSLWRHLRGPRFPALPAKLDGGLVLAVVGQFILDLASRDLHHLDGGTDHVGWAFLAFGASGHGHSVKCFTVSV